MATNDERGVQFAKNLQEVRDQIEEAMCMCVDHYVSVCDTVLFRWKAVIDSELEATHDA